MTRLGQSAQSTISLLEGADLGSDSAVRELLELSWARRSMDLSDLSPLDQAALIAGRCQDVQPGETALAERLTDAAAKDRAFIAKFGIDPTGSQVHIGHAVPMLILSRFQRMGHRVVFIVGDITAKIGDPSGRSDERPPLTDADIARNLATYRDQVSPFFDFTKAEFQFNGDWLREVTLPRLIEIASKIPLSMPLQRDDFRKRLDAGAGISLAELLYSVVMALDSVEIGCDVEIGGIDQFLNMQMCRKVMSICGQDPEIIAATSLIEGTDGTGAKMSKSRGNFVPVATDAADMFGKIMSIPDRLVDQYLRALTEWTDPEITIAAKRVADGGLHPMDLKRIAAGDITAAVHGIDAAMTAREAFAARFSRRNFADLENVPVVSDAAQPVADVVRALGFAKSFSDVRRVAEQNGLRIVVESGGQQEQFTLTADEARQPLASVIKDRVTSEEGDRYLKVGRNLARIPAQ